MHRRDFIVSSLFALPICNLINGEVNKPVEIITFMEGWDEENKYRLVGMSDRTIKVFKNNKEVPMERKGDLYKYKDEWFETGYCKMIEDDKLLFVESDACFTFFENITHKRFTFGNSTNKVV